MARDEPLVPRNFQVWLTLRGPRGGIRDELELPCSQVVMLRRGHTGSDAMFRLWKAERDREREQLRDVLVTVLDERFEPVVGWHFAGCHVVSLDHSTLDALEVEVLTESLEISFKAVEQIAV